MKYYITEIKDPIITYIWKMLILRPRYNAIVARCKIARNNRISF